jgi:hypothetical protein
MELAAFSDWYKEEYEKDNLEGWCGVSIEEAMHECAVDGGYAAVWAISGLASVIGRTIISVYPSFINGDEDLLATVLNRSFRPRLNTDENKYEAVYIMWSRSVPPPGGVIWSSNHFVPLVEYNDPDHGIMGQSEDEVECVKDVQSPHGTNDEADVESEAARCARDMTEDIIETAEVTADNSDNVIKVLEVHKGGIRICYQGFTYVRDRLYKDKIYWRCILRSKCTGRMQTTIVTQVSDNAHIIVEPSLHNHVPDMKLAVRGESVASMRKRVRDAPTQPLFRAYKSSLAEMHEPVDLKSLLPGYRSVRSILQLERANNIPKLPKTKNDINLEGEWGKTLDNEPFILPRADNNTLIFSTDENLKCLSESETLYVDGTFKVCPSLYTQLYSVHGLYKGHVVPLVYALLSDKKSATYYSLLNIIRDALARLGLLLNPKCIMSDFESGLMEAVKLQFPHTQHLGCHFHFGQALWRKCQETGIASEYSENEIIRGFIKKCVALAFIPVSEVLSTFDILTNTLPNDDRSKLDSFITYFFSTWLRGYNLNMWNKYNMASENRTNNVLESWHSGLKRLLPTHPNIFVFVTALKQMQALTQITIAKADCGVTPPKRQRKYVELNKRLEKAFAMYNGGKINTVQLLNKVQHCVNTTKL